MWPSLAQLHCCTTRATKSHQPLEKHNHPASNFLKNVPTMEKCSKVGLAEQVIKRLHPNCQVSYNTHTASSVSQQPRKHADVWAEQPSWAGSHGRAPRETAQEIEEVTATKGGTWKHCPLCLRNGRAQMQFRLEMNGKKQKNSIKGNKKMLYCCPSSTRLEVGQEI